MDHISHIVNFKEMNQIVLDNIIFSLQRNGGVSVVWGNILASVVKHGLNYSCIEYSDSYSNIVRKKMSNISSKVFPAKFIRLKRYINVKIHSKSPFVFHSSYYRICKSKHAINVTTVHDFTYEYYKKGISVLVHKWQKYYAIRHSEVIVCISENTKKDLLKFLPNIDQKRVRVIYNGVSNAFYQLVNKKHYFDNDFVLYVGWRERYKNFNLVVDSISETCYSLAVVGSPLTPDEILYLNNKLGPSRYATFVRISDEELNELYNAALCLAYPSEYEGFGIPVLEAQRAGCPVIAYNGSSIPEIIGNTPLLLSSIDKEEFKEKLSLLEDDLIKEKIINDGLANSRRFSWNRTGDEYVKLYEELAR